MGRNERLKGKGKISNLIKSIHSIQSPQICEPGGTFTPNNAISEGVGKEVLASCSVKKEEGQIIIRVFGVGEAKANNPNLS